tara:strand:+ start:229 stop:633 length:405 start_codon:yes stop_codon:yes gene_type:complete
VGSFEADVNKFQRKTVGKMDQIVRKVALELFTRIIYKTPVDTGRARANWQVSIGTPAAGTVEIDDKSGNATVSQATAKSAGFKAGDTIYLANNLPYIRRLEEGYSQQAPAGMVALTVQEFAAVAKSIGVEISRQ